MKLSQIEYKLPKEFIAHSPISPRDHSNLMVIDRKTGKINHHKFYEIADLLTPDDILVFNETKVFPARLTGIKPTGGKVDILFIEETEPYVWKALTNPRLKTGQCVTFDGLAFKAVGGKGYESYIQTTLNYKEISKLLEKYGKTPLPPYIKSAEKEKNLRREYQTVYAQNVGSVAAPTAGFHFSRRLLKQLINKGVQTEYVTLHVGLGTFLPIKEMDIEKHPMHSEYFEIDPTTLRRLNHAKLAGKRIIAVGTTTTRVLETIAGENGLLTSNILHPTTDLFIYPPYQFKFIDSLITNFHIPHSTLLALVSAFVSYPNTPNKFKDFKSSLMGKAYREAINQNYRFYSFGDSSLII